jgi:hypothetical protein
MAIPISPGVYTKIIDLSAYVQAVPGTIGMSVILCKQGRDNQLVFVSSQEAFASEFGKPNILDFGKNFGQGPYIAMNFLGVASSLYVLRALPDDATYSNMFLMANDATNGIDVVSYPSQNSVAEMDTTAAMTFPVSGGTQTPLCYFRALGRGDYYDNLGIRISEHVNPEVEDIYIIDIYETQSDGDDQIIETFEVSFYEDMLDQSGDSVFIEEVLNKYSKVIRCKVNDVGVKAIEDNEILPSSAFGSQNPVHLENGSEGTLLELSAQTGKIQVNEAVAIQTLVQAYNGFVTNPVTSELEDNILDLDNIYFSLVWDAGYPTEVKTAISSLVVDKRRDCVAIMDNGDNPTANLAIDRRNGTGTIPTEDWHTFNSMYLALYEPYTKVYDMFTGRDIWVSPVYHMSSMIPLNDQLYELWYPSAGFNRGTIDKIKDMRFNCKLGDRDNFYLNQLNPIVKFNVGYTVWGQLTTQRRPSKLQDLHAVRTVLYIKRALEQFCKFFVFEFNDAQTWGQIKVAVGPFLEYIKKARGLRSYNVEVGATEYELKIKTCHVNVMLEPTPIIEKIQLNLFIK